MTTAEKQKEQQLSLVWENAATDWKQQARQIVREAFMLGDTFTGEDIRLICEFKDVKPHHPNAWGAFTRSLRMTGMIEETGEWVAMRSPKSNGRRTPQYRRKA